MKKQPKTSVWITGASKGLGKSLSSLLIQKNYQVFAGVRNEKDAPEGSTAIRLHLDQEASLKDSVDHLLSHTDTIDVIVHNAAVAYWGAVESMTMEEVKHLFQVNFFSIFKLNQLLLPFLRKQNKGKIFFISSVRAVESCAYMGMYSASKAAIEAMALDLACTLEKWNIKVCVVEPGPMDTNISLQHGSHFQQVNPYLPYPEVSLTSQPVSEVAQLLKELIEQKNPPFRVQTSSHVQKTVEKHLVDASGELWIQEQKKLVTQPLLKADLQ